MPLAKPTEVILHRISFAEKEREALDALVATKALNNVANSINGLIAAAGMVCVGYLGTKWWAQYKAGHLDEPSLWDLANDPMKLKKVADEKGFWRGMFDIITTPPIHLDDLI